MLSRTATASLSVSAVSANPSNSFFFFFNASKFLGLNHNLSFSAPNPLSNLPCLSWNTKKTSNKSRMESFTARASAQPLKNADELIDSVETFIFDCDGEATWVFFFIITFCCCCSSIDLGKMEALTG